MTVKPKIIICLGKCTYEVVVNKVTKRLTMLQKS